ASDGRRRASGDGGADLLRRRADTEAAGVSAVRLRAEVIQGVGRSFVKKARRPQSSAKASEEPGGQAELDDPRTTNLSSADATIPARSRLRRASDLRRLPPALPLPRGAAQGGPDRGRHDDPVLAWADPGDCGCLRLVARGAADGRRRVPARP